MGEKSGIQQGLDILKMAYSTFLLVFSIVIVMGLIFTRQTAWSDEYHPAVAFIILWVMLIWLSFVEGGQASLVGLHPINRELYKDTHKIAYKGLENVQKGDNLDRYLMGRQFMVIFIVFLINKSGAPIEGAELWGLPKVVIDIFLVTGIAMILFTAQIGQLQSQVNASLCMLDYFNDYANLFTLYTARAIEFTGLMHFSYLIQIVVGHLAGQPIESKDPPKSPLQKAFFWFRVLVSFVVLSFAMAVTIAALLGGHTTMWNGVPEAVSIILFFILMACVGMLEGMQIAFFAVAKLTPEERGSAKCAKMTCDLLYKGRGHNLPGFMIGRQLSVVSCFFIISRVTTVKMQEGSGNLWGVGDAFQGLFETGFLGAVITTILASISWQLVASAFPIAFLSNPVTYIFLRICLFLEATGICSGAWLMAKIDKKIRGFQRDEVYIGTAEERAAKNMADEEDDLGPGHMYKLPGFPESEAVPDSLMQLMKSDPEVAKYLESLHSQNGGAGADDADIENAKSVEA
jgi:silicon transporter